MNPILIDFPSSFETDRLKIRMPKPGDGIVIHEAIEASREELKEWLPFAQERQTLEETERNTRESHVKFLKREDLRLLIFEKKSGRLIGSSGLHRMDWEVRRFEIGYWLDTRFSGQGFMTEAVEGITAFAFNELKANRVEIRCDTRNQKSRKIPVRLGFELEGILKNEDVGMSGGLRDTCIYAKIKN
ncbi:GNAT family N-acetyltransferase [Thalassobacillus pellis]|uniref:GNAT family N-acetyltransferase n=1 Tax=Thalassobacillus pellis TaxID=748008 RepID=UPI00195F98FB|nr:GNAT family N-acetyltransferase [Thalassobacillus pellis]